MQMTRTTIADVARLAEVSKATASRVLSGSRDRVSPELTQRVLEAAASLDYVPNPHARALASAASPTVAVIVHDVADPYFSEIAEGAFRVAAEADRLVMICTTFEDIDREVAYVREMRAQRMHAVLITGSSTSGLEEGGRLADELRAYRAEGGRVAMMLEGLGYPAAVPDNRAGGRQAGDHLLGLGHRRLGVVSGPAHIASVGDRLAGFLDAVREAGLPEPPIEAGDFTRRGGAKAVDRLLHQDAGITGVAVLNDLMAVGVIRRLEERGRTVPDDVSVAGFDDIPLAEDIRPTLTTVRVPMGDIGAAAMELALAGEDERTVVFPTRLIARESTAEPR